MSDYAKTTNFTAKDSLTTGDPEKLILGADFDTEFNAIVTAIATKYDSDDLASQAEAEAGSSSSKLMTPQRTEQWGDNWAAENAGIVGDLHALADPGADVVLGWDDSAGAAIGFALGRGLATDGTDITVSQSGVTQTGFSPANDYVMFFDTSNSSLFTRVLGSTFNAALIHDDLSGFVANEHINHANVDVIAGAGLTGGGDITSDVTLNVVGGTGITANANDIEVTNGKVLTFASAQTSSEVTISTSAPSGGSNGDIWLQY